MRFRLIKLMAVCLFFGASCAETSSYPLPDSFLPSPAAYPPPATVKVIPTKSPLARPLATITSNEIVKPPRNTSVPTQTTKLYVGDEFQMKIGQEFIVTGTGFSILFVAVTEDSRCPTAINNLACAWEGDLEAVFRLKVNDLKVEFVGLHTCAHCETKASFQEYEITLLRVDPDLREIPIHQIYIRSHDYVATLVVEAASGP